MKLLIKLIVFIFLLFNISFAQKTIAIAELDALGISKGEAKALTDRLRFEIHRSGDFIVIERAMMEEILKEQNFQLSGCVDDACIIEVGKLLAVENIIGGSISKVGSIFSISVRFISVETGEVLGNAQKDFNEKIDYLLTDGIALVTKDLMTSLGAKQLRKITSTRLPLSDYGLIIAKFGFPVNTSLKVNKLGMSPDDESMSTPKMGLNIEIGYYFKPNLFSFGVSIYNAYYRIPFDEENLHVLWQLIEKPYACYNLTYERHLVNSSLTLSTLKTVRYLTPYFLTNIEVVPYRERFSNTDNWGFSEEDGWMDSGKRKFNLALKMGFGATFEMFSNYNFYTNLKVKIASQNNLSSTIIFNFGIVIKRFRIIFN